MYLLYINKIHNKYIKQVKNYLKTNMINNIDYSIYIYILLIMMKLYTCYNCEKFNSDYIKDIIRHCNLKKKCEKNEKAIIYSKDHILLLTLLPNNIHETIIKDDFNKLQNSCVLYDNKNKIFEVLNKKNRKKEKICDFCNKNFNDIIELRKHILLECFLENINFNNNIKNTNNLNIDSSNINSNNINIHANNVQYYNINSNNNTTYNKDVIINNNINIELKYPVSFANDWNTEHINFDKLNTILISNHIMTLYLEEILKNDNNLNVILDNNDLDGLVFDESKYIKMNKEEITDKTMDKINNDITKFLEDDERKEKIFKKYLDETKERLEKKFVDFKQDNTIKNVVINLISNIYQSKKQDAIRKYKEINGIPINKNNNIGF